MKAKVGDNSPNSQPVQFQGDTAVGLNRLLVRAKGLLPEYWRKANRLAFKNLKR
ncbi:MAG: hypothetical protein L0099_14400 [Acidobacteria bacterium]|nr:hypothetical protein [Acidobacteriota bacterium]